MQRKYCKPISLVGIESLEKRFLQTYMSILHNGLANSCSKTSRIRELIESAMILINREMNVLVWFMNGTWNVVFDELCRIIRKRCNRRMCITEYKSTCKQHNPMVLNGILSKLIGKRWIVHEKRNWNQSIDSIRMNVHCGTFEGAKHQPDDRLLRRMCDSSKCDANAVDVKTRQLASAQRRDDGIKDSWNCYQFIKASLNYH